VIELRAESSDVWYAADPGARIGPAEIAFLKGAAAASPRLRSRICLHADPDAPLHEMVIVHHRSCYVRPHRHPAKPESLTVIEGSATGLYFDAQGEIVTLLSLAPSAVSIWRIPQNAWHGLVIASEWFVFYEVSSGPFVPGVSEFPAWAPHEREDSARAYAEAIRDRCVSAPVVERRT